MLCNQVSQENKMEDGVRFAESHEELEASYRLRYSVYIEGMGRLKDKADHTRKELRDAADEVARCIIAVKNNTTIGTLRVFWGKDSSFSPTLVQAYNLDCFLDNIAQEKICIAERLVVDEVSRGSSTTLLIYKELMHFVIKNKIEAVFLDCEPHHLNSYLKLGFRPFASTYSYPGIGLVIPMVLVSGDYQHMKQVGSPFALLTREQDLDYCHYTETLLSIILEQNKIISQNTTNYEKFLEIIYEFMEKRNREGGRFLDGFSEEELEKILRKTHIIECRKGSQITVRGNPSQSVYILLSGMVEIRHNNELQAIIMSNDVMGDVSYFLDLPWVVDMYAATDIKILTINDVQLSLILKTDVLLANKLLMKFCQCLSQKIIDNADLVSLRDHANSK